MDGIIQRIPRPCTMSDSDPPAPDDRPRPTVAYVAGTAVEELPVDLYIPPNALEVCLETFEGPLDLLLYLIKRRNIDILEVDVAEITDQYMAYIELMRAGQFELAAEYMAMAAMLAEIKSRLLLPQPQPAAEEEQADPRMQLIRRLLEYERYKLAAENLDGLPRLDRELRQARAGLPELERVIPQPAVTLPELLAAMADALRQAELSEHHRVSPESISMEEKIGHLSRGLEYDRFLPLASLLDPREGRLGVVVTFLAILQMMRDAKIEIVQSDMFGPVHLRLARGGKSA